MKKIFSILLIIAVIFILASNVFCHQGNLDSFGGHVVVQDGYITAYHFHKGQLDGYDITLTDKVKAENIEELKKYVKTLDVQQLAKLGTIRKMPIDTATNQTIKPSATSTSSATISKTETVTSSPKPTIAVTTIATKVLPKTGERENTVMLVAGMFILFIGAIFGLVIKSKKTN